ncbi:uncharacterized protein RHOBADRAFT_56628 [Rhodotorula graminis WP1]|uniref:Uncharacterized protein n=1 Tax=Rhodotorula graminis (strain WP1) TaxID=578459 RepID=A0A0P9IPQ5_RHOGW|nr:uncharacterized protein RHOBADRAFT_56628 [Rhodotorula graminis WP1]KPV71436.1 hypothetical protein RHOBADRAFT_56628 [Rhodotorula graminis WP1]
MSAEPHKYWPSVGTTYPHWADLLLATQLAAARAGFNYLGRYFDQRRPAQLSIVCMVHSTQMRASGCTHSLIEAVAVDSKDAMSGWRVSKVNAQHLDAQRHPGHTLSRGLSSWLKKRPADLVLKPGDTVTGFRDLHTIEGALRAQNRRQGRFLAGRVAPTAKSASCEGYQINCVLDTSRCTFFVRFEGLSTDLDGERTWRCVEVRSEHSCVSTAKPLSEKLQWRLNFWVTLVDGALGKPVRQSAPSTEEHEVVSDRFIGPFPMLSLPTLPTYRSSSPPLMPALADADSSDSPTALASLLPNRQALASAEKELADASTAVDKLKSDLAAAENRADVQRGRVEKKRAKLQRRLERERSKRKSVKEGPRSKDKKRDVKRAGERKKKAEMLALSD